MAKQSILFQLRNGIILFSGIGFILGFLGTYLSLYKLKKNLILAGTVFSILGLTLAIGFHVGDHAVVLLAINYAKATSENLQISYVAAAELIRSVTGSGHIFCRLLCGVGILISGIAMLAGVFSKKAAYLFIIYGSLSIIAALGKVFNPMFGLINLLGVIPGIIGMLLIAIRLIAISKQVEPLQKEF